MTVTTIDAEATGVVLVAELHGLLAHGLGARDVRRAAQAIEREAERRQQYHQYRDASTGILIGTGREDLRHLRGLWS
jgi:hypothetical protein